MLSGEELFGWVTLTRAPALDVPILSAALDILYSPQNIVSASDAGWRPCWIMTAAGSN